MSIATQEKIIDQLNDFIYQTFPRARAKTVAVTDMLLDQGIVDSLGLLEIVGFIESTFDINVQDTDMVAENFASISAIASYVERSLNGS